MTDPVRPAHVVKNLDEIIVEIGEAIPMRVQIEAVWTTWAWKTDDAGRRTQAIRCRPRTSEPVAPTVFRQAIAAYKPLRTFGADGTACRVGTGWVYIDLNSCVAAGRVTEEVRADVGKIAASMPPLVAPRPKFPPAAAAPSQTPAATSNVTVTPSVVPVPPTSVDRPEPQPPDEVAYYGLAGDIVRAIEPYTEADPIALLAITLTETGNLIGLGPHHLIGVTPHPAKICPVLTGETGMGRKGEAQDQVDDIIGPTDPEWHYDRHKSGLTTGQGLAWQVRDPIERIDKKGQTYIADEGVADKQLVIVEREMASVLALAHQQGNNLSPKIRDSWDGKPLGSMTKVDPYSTRESFISIIAHVTRQELLDHLTTTDVANGLANRFLWLWVRRVKELADPQRVPLDVMQELRIRIGSAVGLARTRSNIPASVEAKAMWDEGGLYHDLSTRTQTLLGEITNRAAQYVKRLALAHALLDKAFEIRPEHLSAALALWRYSERSLEYIFGDATGNPTADAILRALRRQTPLDQGALHDAIGGHTSAERLGSALDLLQRLGRVSFSVRPPTPRGGRPATMWSLLR